MGIVIDEVESTVVPDSTPSLEDGKGSGVASKPEIEKIRYLLSRAEQLQARLRAD